MKKITVLSIVAASLLLVGCGDEAKEKTAETAKAVTEATTSTTEKAASSNTGVIEKAASAVTETASSVVEKTAEVAHDAKVAVAEKATEAKEVASKAVEATKEAVEDAKNAVSEKATEVKEAVAEKVEDAKASVATPTINLTACGACHGKDFEKKAMGVSKVVKDMSKADIETALKGYKDGSYGANMKALMKGQVAAYDDAKIKAIAEQIGK